MLKNILLYLIVLVSFIEISFSQECNTLKNFSPSYFEVSGIERSYYMFTPLNLDEGQAFPLLISLHGLGRGAKEMYQSGMNKLAIKENFAVCYPQGYKNRWNAGTPEFDNGLDDVYFIKELINEISSQYNIDHNNIFVYGMSNGGFMCYTLACEMSEQIKAIASVSGSMTPFQFKNCNPSKQVNILQIHGTEDDIVPLKVWKPYSVPVEKVISFWKNEKSCKHKPGSKEISSLVKCDKRKILEIDYKKCNSELKLISVFDAKHQFFCFSNHQIWSFFKKFLKEQEKK